MLKTTRFPAMKSAVPKRAFTSAGPAHVACSTRVRSKPERESGYGSARFNLGLRTMSGSTSANHDFNV